MSNRWKCLIYFNSVMLVSSVSAAMLSLSLFRDYVGSIYHLATLPLALCFCIDIFPLSFGVPRCHDSREYVRSYWAFFAAAVSTIIAEVAIVWILTNQMNAAI